MAGVADKPGLGLEARLSWSLLAWWAEQRYLFLFFTDGETKAQKVEITCRSHGWEVTEPGWEYMFSRLFLP